MIYLCQCGNTEFVLGNLDSKPGQRVGDESLASVETRICSNGNCARPVSQAFALRLVCPGCQYDHLINDRVINQAQTLICAHCAERWELDYLKMQAIIQAYEAGRVSPQAIALGGGN